MKINVNIAGVDFKNPIISASGTFGFGQEYNKFYDVSVLGGICTKGLTLKPRQGNPVLRIAETNMGMLNSVGLQNPGLDAFIKEEMPFLENLNTVIIANIAGNSEDDYCLMAEKISDINIDMIELNISCPNVKEGGIAFGVIPNSVEKITVAVKKYCKKPLIVKLSPNVANIADNAKAAELGGADCISLINTVGGMAIDYRTRKPILANIYGGLSGPCVKPIALKMVHEAYKAVKIPIIGLGGRYSAEDILEFMIAGARAVQIGTVNISDPNAGNRLVIELTNLIKSCNIDNINDIVGTLTY